MLDTENKFTANIETLNEIDEDEDELIEINTEAYFRKPIPVSDQGNIKDEPSYDEAMQQVKVLKRGKAQTDSRQKY